VKPAVVLAGAVLVAAPIAAAVLFRPGTGATAAAVAPATTTTTTTTTTTPAAPATPGFPAPPDGAVVFARELGGNDLALGVVPGAGSVLAQASLVSQQGKGVTGRSVSFVAQGKTIEASACGPGCYRATLPVKGRPATVDVIVRGTPSTRWRVAMPATWPPKDGTALVDRAEAVWTSLRSLSFDESLSSGTGVTVYSAWQVQAPDRLAYQVKGGWQAVIVGPRRWDKAPGAASKWVESPQSQLTQPIPGWVSVKDAHVIGPTTYRGKPATLVTFYDPGTPGWFALTIDDATARTMRVEMIATAHFMQDDFDAFDATAPIEPPR